VQADVSGRATFGGPYNAAADGSRFSVRASAADTALSASAASPPHGWPVNSQWRVRLSARVRAPSLPTACCATSLGAWRRRPRRRQRLSCLQLCRPHAASAAAERVAGCSVGAAGSQGRASQQRVGCARASGKAQQPAARRARRRAAAGAQQPSSARMRRPRVSEDAHGQACGALRCARRAQSLPARGEQADCCA